MENKQENKRRKVIVGKLVFENKGLNSLTFNISKRRDGYSTVREHFALMESEAKKDTFKPIFLKNFKNHEYYSLTGKYTNKRNMLEKGKLYNISYHMKRVKSSGAIVIEFTRISEFVEVEEECEILI